MSIFFIFGAQYLIFLPFIVLGIYLFNRSKFAQRRIVIFILISFALGDIAWLVANQLYHNPRPFVVEHFIPLVLHDPVNGFPSGHTLVAALLASVFTFLNRRIALVLWVATLFIGVSRVYVGVHHLVDIAGSMFIALAVTSITYFTLRRFGFFKGV